jgi:transcriptional regulator with XRE-family HTH domain
MSLADRISARIKALGTSARAISLEVGPNTHLVQAILSGKTQNPRIDTLQKLAGALKTNTEWLVNGVGDPDQEESPATAEVTSIMPKLDERRRGQLADYARFLAEQAKADRS